MAERDPLAEEVISDWQTGQAERLTTLAHWQQVANYLYPDRADFIIERWPGQKRMMWIYNEVPLDALDDFAALLHAHLTSDTLPWFFWQTDDERVNAIDRVTAWLGMATSNMLNIFNSPRLNFATQSHEVYLDEGAFGTACMSEIEDGESDDIVFATHHLKECVFVENDKGRIDQVSRRWRWTAKKAFTKWGTKAGEAVAKAYSDGKDGEKFWFHHRVRPRRLRDDGRADPRNMAFESVYVGESDRCVIAESGFPEFPYLCPRWAKISNLEVDGRGIGMKMLPAIKMLNDLERQYILAGELANRPPLQLPDEGYTLPIKTEPGARVYYRAGMRPTDRAGPLLTGANPPAGEAMIQLIENRIRKAFLNDLLVTPVDPRDPASAGKGVTATFTNRQTRENAQRLSGNLARANAEWTAPLLERTFNILWRRSVNRRFGRGSPFPPPPLELRGMRLHPEYKSAIALAQRATEMSAVDQVVARQQQFRVMDPTAPMVVDTEAVLRLEVRDLSAPIGILKTAERLRAEAEAQARMVQQAHEAQIAQQGAGAAQSLAGAHAAMRQAA